MIFFLLGYLFIIVRQARSISGCHDVRSKYSPKSQASGGNNIEKKQNK